MQAGQHLVFLRCFQTQLHGALFDLVVGIEDINRADFFAGDRFGWNGQNLQMLFHFQNHIGIHARHQFEVGIRHFYFRDHRARVVIHLISEARNHTGEHFAIQRIHAHGHGIAQLDVFDVIHRYRKIETQPVIIRNAHERQRLRIRRRASLNERAGIRVTMRDHAIKWRGDLGVANHRLKFFKVSFCGGDGGRRGQIVGLRGVEILLRNEIGMLLVDRL